MTMKSFVKEYEERYSIFRRKYEVKHGTLFKYWRRNPVVVIPKKVSRIASGAFIDKNMIESVTFSDRVKEVGVMAFQECIDLKSVHISGLTAWCNISFADDYANPLCQAKKLYLNGELITSLAIPEGITEIKNFAFEGCEPLTDVIIPSGVTRIGWSAFRDCINLKSITIPNTVKFIGRSMIGGCINLENIFYQGTKAEWEAIEKWKKVIAWDAKAGDYTIRCVDGEISSKKARLPMFATGAFAADGLTLQKYHDKEIFDDDVVSRISETDKASFPDGYVSNIGNAVTIYIKKELNTADTIEFIKKIFFLNSPDLTVSVEPFFGW